MEATLYLPSQPARRLSATELSNLRARLVPSAHTEDEQMLAANWEVVSALLQDKGCDLILATPTACAYGVENAADFDHVLNAEAESHLTRLFDYSELVGPILIIEA